MLSWDEEIEGFCVLQNSENSLLVMLLVFVLRFAIVGCL